MKQNIICLKFNFFFSIVELFYYIDIKNKFFKIKKYIF